MGTANKNMSAEQIRATQQRKKRVQKIRNTIVFIVVFVLLGSIVSSIYLNIRVANLQSQIDTLTKTTINDYMKLATEQAKEQFERENASLLSSQYPDTTEDNSAEVDTTDNTTEDISTEDIAYVYDCISPESNIASAEDTHVVYLTFDDGPSINTDKILEVLANHGVKATFFVTGRDDETQVAKYNDIYQAGHTIGVHSYSHKYNELYSSEAAFNADLDRITNTIYDATGEYPKYYRFPGGSNCDYSSVDMKVFTDCIGKRGMKYFDWNVSSGDANSQIYSVDELVDNVMSDIVKYKYSVVLLHDASDKTKTVEALDLILSRLESIDAQIMPITDDSPVIHLSGDNTN